MTLIAAVCALQVVQFIFTVHHGYDITVYNPSPRAVQMTAMDVEFTKGDPVTLPIDKPVSVRADYGLVVSIHGADDRRRDPLLMDFKPECHDEGSSGDSRD